MSRLRQKVEVSSEGFLNSGSAANRRPQERESSLVPLPKETVEIGRPEGLQYEVDRELDRLRAREAAKGLLAAEQAEAAMAAATDSAVTGLDFLFSEVEPEPVWGVGSKVLWAAGEGLLIAGPPGVGKSTLAQGIALARVGYAEDDLVLGMPVQADPRPTVYLAMDRVAQIRRSFKRMVDPDSPRAKELEEKLVFYPGSPPFNAAEAPEAFAEWVVELAVKATGEKPGTVIVDSYKDLVPNLNEDRAGSGLNRAMQVLVNQGVEWLGIHHVKKPSADNKKLTKLTDVYGSTWLTAGAGSVLLLEGAPGNSGAELHHAKQPAEAVGPLVIRHDHASGRTTPIDPRTALRTALSEAGATGLTKRTAAEAVYGESSESNRRRVERDLGKLVDRSEAEKIPGQKGGRGGGNETRWVSKIAKFNGAG